MLAGRVPEQAPRLLLGPVVCCLTWAHVLCRRCRAAWHIEKAPASKQHSLEKTTLVGEFAMLVAIALFADSCPVVGWFGLLLEDA